MTRWYCVKSSMGCLVYLQTRFGNPVVEYKGYRYNKRSNSKPPKACWVCVKVAVGCKARIFTIHNEIYKIDHSHNHGPTATSY